MLNGIQNFLQFINDNWTVIVIIISLCVALYRKIKAFLQTSNDDKIKAAKVQAKESMLKWITDAEVDYADWVKAGSIKRSQVIQKVFEMYPVLAKITNQEEIIAWIDDQINTALKELRKIVAENAEDNNGN